MPFATGRGRPPVGSPEVGTVSWEEKSVCFVGSNGFYWHGTKFGGWQKEAPDENHRESNPVTPVSTVRGRRPKGNKRVGGNVTHNIEHNCYETDKKYYWHGSFTGGWRKNAPGTDPASDDDDEKDSDVVGNEEEEETTEGSNKKQKKGNTKGRPPRGKTDGEVVEYDTENLCWKTDRDGGLYWHGTHTGGWMDQPPKKR